MRLLAAAILAAPVCAAGAGQPLIEIFPGYGNPQTLWVSGRVYEAPHGSSWSFGSAASGIANPFGALERLFRGSAGEEVVSIRAGAVRAHARTGGGYFDAVLRAAPGAPWGGAVRVTAVSSANEEFDGTAYVPSPDSNTELITAIDDTLTMAAPADARAAVKDAPEGDGQPDRPVPGMAQLYARFAGGAAKKSRPVCYIAASPDTLSARIAGFLSINRFPPGPLMLMRPEQPGTAPAPSPQRVYDHTLTAIQNILAAWPEKKFVLFGGGGKEDPDIYRCIAEQYRTRIRGVYLRRSGDKDPAREKAYPGFVFFDTAEEAEKDLARKGIISD
ncbi:MAG: App1 family protein [Chlamydiota bacterium]